MFQLGLAYSPLFLPPLSLNQKTLSNDPAIPLFCFFYQATPLLDFLFCNHGVYSFRDIGLFGNEIDQGITELVQVFSII